MRNTRLNWKVGGEAGYGIMTVGEIFSRAFVRGGYFVVAHTEYPSLIRGGHNTFQVRIDDTLIRAPIRPIDILVALNAKTVDLHLDEVVPGGIVVHDSKSFQAAKRRSDVTWCDVPLAQLVKDLHLPKVTLNMAAMGASVALIGYDLEVLNDVIHDFFEDKGQEIVEQNVTAASAGHAYVAKTYPNVYKGGMPRMAKTDRITLTGNDAICMGALKAGMKFIAIYPMTPTHNIMTYMAAHKADYGVAMVQPEDEIAGINMAIGASFAGARSMVATSGGGFSLMVEGLGLAGMTENPLVIVEGQRPGPSTALATRTAQGDLRFCMHASQGEFLRVVVAPGDPEECFYQAFNAFNLADALQTPVLLLTDKHLATSYFTAAPFDTTGLHVDRGMLLTHDVPADFKRYVSTPSGVSPRTIPGTPGGIFNSNSDEHDERGYVSEQSRIVAKLVDKRCAKYFTAAPMVDGVKYHGNPASGTVLVGWGSTKGAILDAVDYLRAHDGVDLGFLQVLYMSPFPSDKVRAQLADKAVILIENNRGAQLGSLIKEHAQVRPDHTILLYDGRAFFADDLVQSIKEVL
ncbi:MAG: 2-oxoacid:acceptor oxidoreductase subunit alpha [Euryarchaeota archaeon]|nr:2-oxoacid:acceptor oxidoreductase subunit alpha [Euryarchaeota archaeon]